ncbi:hypothetical protein MA16_Dca007686 [Dendrobium catenatum]|uniref:Uncharacterized protein n=1 Tax=Dendrobium catenatum TaxID=906689 RepID=A0A2I0X100_9ASPA|nr:hypothetical protein MA16_Dca007686 [Dendrobium catenatum]
MGLSLRRNVHLQPRVLTEVGLGISVQVPIFFNAINSACITLLHSGWIKAIENEVGSAVGFMVDRRLSD